MDRGSDPKQPGEDRLLLNALADGELDAATARSLEKRPLRATLRMALRAQTAGWRKSFSASLLALI